MSPARTFPTLSDKILVTDSFFFPLDDHSYSYIGTRTRMLQHATSCPLFEGLQGHRVVSEFGYKSNDILTAVAMYQQVLFLFVTWFCDYWLYPLNLIYRSVTLVSGNT